VQKFREAADLADRHYRTGAVPIATYVELQNSYLDAVEALLDTQRETLAKPGSRSNSSPASNSTPSKSSHEPTSLVSIVWPPRLCCLGGCGKKASEEAAKTIPNMPKARKAEKAA
jgi:hypothetical protein